MKDIFPLTNVLFFAVLVFASILLSLQTLRAEEREIALTYVGDSGGWQRIEAAIDGPFGAMAAAHKPTSGTEFLEYSLGAKYEITRAGIDEDNSGNWQVESWQLQAWVDENWVSLFPFRPSDQAGWNEVEFPGVTTDRVRFLVRHPRHVEVRELRLFGHALVGTCSDGVQNQFESGIDCGGPCSNECSGVPAFETLPENVSCVVGEPPPLERDFRFRRIWEAVFFEQPLGVVQAPGGEEAPFYVVSKLGTVTRVPADDNATQQDTTLFLDLSNEVVIDAEGGLLGLVFDPNYLTNGYVYVSYMDRDPELLFRITRYTTTDGGFTVDPESALTIFQTYQDSDFHQSGAMAFAADGTLFISHGDDLTPARSADLTEIKGSILRIDVSTFPYSIPEDNPFGNEIWAYGFRNPWRMTLDRFTQDLWVSDVGQCDWEEVNRIKKGRFYGWPYFEGNTCYTEGFCDVEYEEPDYAYPHPCPQFSAVVGGYVYRGAQIPSLYGQYLFADFIKGTVSTLNPGTKEVTELFNLPGGISSFGEDNQGEIYYTNLNYGEVFRLEPDTSAPSSGEGPPENLFDTGCFDSLGNPPTHAPGVVPYTIAHPFWSDGADKERWIALPPGGRIRVDESGDWELPPGAVTLKHFLHQGEYFETRLLVRYLDGSYGGYTYKWLDENTAVLADAGGEEAQIGSRPWKYPSRGQCFDCHTPAANFSLSLETQQLNIEQFYPSVQRVANQVATFRAAGMVEENSGIYKRPYPSLWDSAHSFDERARAYLHVNCQSCHFGERSGWAQWDARFSVALADKNLCDVVPGRRATSLSQEKLLLPGDSHASTLWRRMSQRETLPMPSIGSEMADRAGSLLFARWIGALSSCGEEPSVGPTIPHTFEAEEYDRAFELSPSRNFGGECDRGDGVDMELSQDVAGGNCSVGWTSAGEWLEFDFHAPNDGVYLMVFRVASAFEGRTATLELDGAKVDRKVLAPGEGWYEFRDRTVGGVSLSKGNHTLRVTFETGLINLNYVSILAQ